MVVSLHYEWMLTLRLRPDVPATFLAELRFHLGLSAEPPELRELDYDWPCLVADLDDALPGGSVRSLIPQRPYPNRPGSYGLFVRTFVLDDGMYELMSTVPQWLARWSLTEGWIGLVREELDLQPWLYFYAQDGRAYAGEPGKPITAINGEGAPFTLGQTTDLPTRDDGDDAHRLASRPI